TRGQRSGLDHQLYSDDGAQPRGAHLGRAGGGRRHQRERRLRRSDLHDRHAAAGPGRGRAARPAQRGDPHVLLARLAGPPPPHMADRRPRPPSSSSRTWTLHTAQAVAPPAPATGLTLTPGVAQIGLDWILPAGDGLGKIRVVRRAGTAPTGPADPAAVTFDLAPTAHSYTDTS